MTDPNKSAISPKDEFWWDDMDRDSQEYLASLIEDNEEGDDE